MFWVSKYRSIGDTRRGHNERNRFNLYSQIFRGVPFKWFLFCVAHFRNETERTGIYILQSAAGNDRKLSLNSNIGGHLDFSILMAD